MILDEIVAYKKIEIAHRESSVPLSTVRSLAAKARTTRDFASALKAPGISLIAEVKHKSPSRGVLRQDFDPQELARIYALNGARAISVLADEHFFGGSTSLVQRIANAADIQVPILFKDFILSPYQVYEARAMGADALLLIVRTLGQSMLEELLAIAHELGMEALVEVYQREEAERALAAGARIIGVNNRDLQTFEVDTARSEAIRAMLPREILSVSESGLSSRADVMRAEESGFDAMLVGEALVKAPDVGARVREFLGLSPLS
jgi:indole-3-glycerol phosphate synthase